MSWSISASGSRAKCIEYLKAQKLNPETNAPEQLDQFEACRTLAVAELEKQPAEYDPNYEKDFSVSLYGHADAASRNYGGSVSYSLEQKPKAPAADDPAAPD